jgi:DNA polymerase elongation subunit (family B)
MSTIKDMKYKPENGYVGVYSGKRNKSKNDDSAEKFDGRDIGARVKEIIENYGFHLENAVYDEDFVFLFNRYVESLEPENDEHVYVWERDEKGTRDLKTFPFSFYFYVPDENGDQTTIFGEQCRKIECKNSYEFERQKRIYPKRFESDFSPMDRVLMNVYYGVKIPKLNYAFTDIEVDYDPEIGFDTARPGNAKNPINAITIYKQWRNQYVTLVVPPPGWDGELPEKMSLKDLDSDVISDLKVCKNEEELIDKTLEEFKYSDVISGWNSEFYDMPYLVERSLVLDRMCYLRELMQNPNAKPKLNFTKRWNFNKIGIPKWNTVEQYGSLKPTVSLIGRNHLDYLKLFQKFTFEGRESFSLASIAEEELEIPKLEYDGTLAELYRNNFIYFILYNIRDVEIIHRLDEKFKFINLASQLAHENTVPLEAVLGTVKYVETGITNFAHRVFNKVVHDKTYISDEDKVKVEGAIVLTPKIGLHEWIGSVDINSLYPSVIRSLNISPEMIIGQFTKREDDWRGIKDKDSEQHVLFLESGEQLAATGQEWYDIFVESKWAISAYGTVFDQSVGKGLVTSVLENWYSERKKLQAEKKKWTAICSKLSEEGKTNTPEYEEAHRQEEFYDLLQLTKKIQL